MPHAILSPSSGKRWTICTPSARLEEGFADTESEFAKEGTLAHLIAEMLLRSGENYLHINDWKIFKKNPLYTESMYEYVQDYVTYVRSLADPDEESLLFAEERLDLESLIPEGFGTGDAAVVQPRIKQLDVADLKFGKGVLVEIEDNTQLKIYALGWLELLNLLYGFEIQTVRMHIYQPRLQNVGFFELTAKELYDWAEDFLKPRALIAFAGEGDFVPGKHCEFCKAKAQCKALADYNFEIAQYEFQDERLLSPKETADILFRSSQFINWIGAVAEYALSQSVHNSVRWPGYKLVEGRTKRAYSDERIIASAIMRKLHTGDIYKPKSLLAMDALKNRIGVKHFKTLVEPLLVKPQGKPTLVPDSDPRPEFNSVDSALKDFAEDFDESFDESFDEFE